MRRQWAKSMKWYPQLYAGPEAEKKRNKIIRKLKCNMGQVNVYLITFAANETDLFDILPAYLLKQKAVRRRLPMIVGIAVGYGEAVDLVIKIVEETLRETGSADVKQYLKSR